MKLRQLLGLSVLLLLLMFSWGEAQQQSPRAKENGDVNGDLTIDMSDAVYLLEHLFIGGPAPVPVVLAQGGNMEARVAAIERLTRYMRIGTVPSSDGEYPAIVLENVNLVLSSENFGTGNVYLGDINGVTGDRKRRAKHCFIADSFEDTHSSSSSSLHVEHRVTTSILQSPQEVLITEQYGDTVVNPVIWPMAARVIKDDE